MEASLPTSEPAVPEGVSKDELYDGPKVVPHPAASDLVRSIKAPVVPAPDLSHDAQREDQYPAVILLALDVLSARLLGIVALATACVVWAGVVWNPDMWRIVAAGVFSVLVFLPVMMLYWKAGMMGEKGQ